MRANRAGETKKESTSDAPAPAVGVTSKGEDKSVTLKFKLMTGQEKTETFTEVEMQYFTAGQVKQRVFSQEINNENKIVRLIFQGKILTDE